MTNKDKTTDTDIVANASDVDDGDLDHIHGGTKGVWKAPAGTATHTADHRYGGTNTCEPIFISTSSDTLTGTGAVDIVSKRRS